MGVEASTAVEFNFLVNEVSIPVYRYSDGRVTKADNSPQSSVGLDDWGNGIFLIEDFVRTVRKSAKPILPSERLPVVLTKNELTRAPGQWTGKLKIGDVSQLDLRIEFDEGSKIVTTTKSTSFDISWAEFVFFVRWLRTAWCHAQYVYDKNPTDFLTPRP